MSQFQIEFEPLSMDYGDEWSGLAEIRIFVNEWSATELVESGISRKATLASVSLLAEWFAWNWWRLRWEPSGRSPTLDWLMSHQLSSAGGGFLWPNLLFVGDGAMVQVKSESSSPSSGQPVRYVNDFVEVVKAEEFERAIDTFMGEVLTALGGKGEQAADLHRLWSEVSEERRNPDSASFRKLEALMGFDPDDGPVELIDKIHDSASLYGSEAVEEVAAEAGTNALQDLEDLWNEPRRSATMMDLNSLSPALGSIRDAISHSSLPWLKASTAAMLVRETWSLAPGPVADSVLLSVLDLPSETILKSESHRGPMIAGFRENGHGKVGVHLRSPYSENRRFALMRIVGDSLIAPAADRLLPAAPHVRTYRQKFQRAFAQEFLCPYADLKEFLGERIKVEDQKELIREAADYFRVSEMTISTLLVNRGTEGFEDLASELRAL